MFKENDIAALSEAGESWTDTVSRIISGLPVENESFTTIEVRNGEDAMAAARAWNGRSSRLVLMLDNMSPVEAGEVVNSLDGENLRELCIIEGSGGVTIESLSKWADSGVDVVSSSRLNLGVTPSDFSVLFRGA